MAEGYFARLIMGDNDSAVAALSRQGEQPEMMSYSDDVTDGNGSTVVVTGNTSYPRTVTSPPLLSKSIHMVALYTIAYVIVFVLAVMNNSLVVSVIVRNPAMRNVTNYFLGNLAVADILVSLIVLPFTLTSQIFLGK